MTVRDSELPLKDKTLRLWVADPDAAWADPGAPEVVAVLSADERARLRSLLFAANRREFLAAHFLVRRALSCHRSYAGDMALAFPALLDANQ